LLNVGAKEFNTYCVLHAALLVTPVEMHVTIRMVFGDIVDTKLESEAFTVTTPDELLTIKKGHPVLNVEVAGSTTVCVVTPVKYCNLLLVDVKVVVPAAVAVVV